ncbi:MAG: PEP-utilizing enzyme, partial [Acidobacteriota bacterium]
SAPAEAPDDHVLDDAGATRVARAAWAMERHFGCPQDVEWVVDETGALLVVQTRPLQMSPLSESGATEAPPVDGYRVLVRGAVSASGGAASGEVFVLVDPALADTVPEGAVLVTPTTSPRLAGLLPSVAAVVAAAGSATGHMATVAREFGVPCLVGVGAALANLRDGATVTVDAWTGTVYEGEVQGLAPSASGPEAARRRNAVQEGLQRLLERTAPLTLTEPDSPEFKADNCRTLHDIARFVHQRAMAEMFELEGLSAVERRASKRLDWRMPMPVLMLDLGGGLAPFAGSTLRQEYVNSTPLLALIEGMTDPRLRWSGPVGFDPRGFMSVVVRSAVDDQRYGEPSYALCARDYVHFASRLAYHFATVDAVCGSIVNENYARFLFHGGAAVAQRREWRAHFLALVLEYNLFAVKQTGDRVEAILAKRPAEQIEEALVMLGRLMVASRHLDMVMESHAAAESLAQAFLAGDFGFDRVRRGMS